jgi:hypothetical protein
MRGARWLLSHVRVGPTPKFLVVVVNSAFPFEYFALAF